MLFKEHVAKTEVQRMSVQTVELITIVSQHYPDETTIPVRTAAPGQDLTNRREG
jgi:hypothetical protein